MTSSRSIVGPRSPKGPWWIERYNKALAAALLAVATIVANHTTGAGDPNVDVAAVIGVFAVFGIENK